MGKFRSDFGAKVSGQRASAVSLGALCLLLAACTQEAPAGESVGARRDAVVQTCTATNVSGNPYKGQLCGGAFIDDCTPGLVYSCKGGPRGTTNNCTLSRTCAIACLTDARDTPVTANIGTATPVASDACFVGAAPLTFSTSSTAGGNSVTMTATLEQSHSPYAIVNFRGTTAEVPPLCSPPLFLFPSATSVSWVEPTGVVAAVTSVPLWVLISFNDVTGALRNLVSVPSTLTLNPGGARVVPPLLSFSVTDAGGAPLSRIPGGTNAFTHGTLAASTPAPVGGVRVTVTGTPASAFVTDGSFFINAGCTTNSDLGVLTATSDLTADQAATVSATDGAGPTLFQNVVVTPPVLNLQSLVLTPSTVVGGDSLIATVTLNRVVLPGDASSTLSLRVSEGLTSGAQVATFPGCLGTPACTGALTVPAGARSASVTLSTRLVGAQDVVTVSASAVWSNASPAAQLTINPGGAAAPTLSSLVMAPSSGNCGFSSSGTVTLTGAAPAGGASVTLSSSSPANAQVPASVTVPSGQTQASFTATTGPSCTVSSVVITASFGGASRQNALFFNNTACTPTTCAAQGASCGTIPDGCGGTLGCGSCVAPQSCGGGGVANVCGGGGTAALTLTATGRGGESLFSTPAGLTVASGTTGAADFPVGSSVTLQATNGRSVIWSGACSSAGARVKACTFRIGGPAQVTGEIQ